MEGLFSKDALRLVARALISLFDFSTFACLSCCSKLTAEICDEQILEFFSSHYDPQCFRSTASVKMTEKPLLGRQIGVGGFSDVFTLGMCKNVVVKLSKRMPSTWTHEVTRLHFSWSCFKSF